MELDDILSDKEPEAPKEPAAKEPAAAEPKEPAEPAVDRPKPSRKEHMKREYAAQGRDPDTGQFVAKEQPVQAEPVPTEQKAAEPTESPKGPPAAPEPSEAQKAWEREKAALLKAALDERNKRQELERQLAQPTKPAQPQEPAKTFWEDPEGHLNAIKEQSSQVALQTKLQTAEMIARSRYQDFDQEVAVFKEMALSVPGLAQQCFSSPDPAEFAYRTGKFHRELNEAGGLAQLRTKIEAETRAKVETEFKAKEEARLADMARQRAALPGSLSDVRGAAASKRMEYTGPTPLDVILGKS